jgi:hypothetical protein
MAGWLSNKRRWRAAATLVALYALCLATPTAVLAFSQIAVPAHCLTDHHHGIGTAHVHQDGSSVHHSDPGEGDDRNHPTKCCGLFTVSAIAPALDFVLAQHPSISFLPALLTESLHGRNSDRIDRPPRSLLSL